MTNKKVKKIKVVDFINQLNKIGYNENTVLEFDTVDGNTGEVYDLNIKKFISGDDYSVPHENVIDIEMTVSEEYIKAKSTIYVEDIEGVLNKYRPKRYY